VPPPPPLSQWAALPRPAQRATLTELSLRRGALPAKTSSRAARFLPPCHDVSHRLPGHQSRCVFLCAPHTHALHRHHTLNANNNPLSNVGGQRAEHLRAWRVHAHNNLSNFCVSLPDLWCRAEVHLLCTHNTLYTRARSSYTTEPLAHIHAHSHIMNTRTHARTLQIAMASISSSMGMTEQNLEKHIAFAENAARQGAKIVIFPEVRHTHDPPQHQPSSSPIQLPPQYLQP
jgi:hypothetical protein